MTFGKSNAKIYVEAQTGKSFADVAGQDEAKEALSEIVDFLHAPKRYTGLRHTPQRRTACRPSGNREKLCLHRLWQGRQRFPFSRFPVRNL